MINRLARLFGFNTFTSNEENKEKSFLLQNYGNSVVNNLNVPFTLYPASALRFYSTLSPLTDAIDRITQEVAGIKPLIFDIANEVYIKDHPILDLLNKPNTNITYHDFMISLATCFLSTGNGFIANTFRPGKTDDPPLELFNLFPQDISIISSSVDGYASIYQKSGAFDQDKFYRYYRGFRFFDNEDAKQATKEIYQIKKFNPNGSDSNQRLWGLPDSLSIYYELMQFQMASVHNLSQLGKGARPSGIFTIENNITDEQFQRLQAQINNFYQGVQNSGNVMLLTGGKAQFTPASQNNKDMDFDNLCKSVITRIYNKFKVPLPLINPDSMTLSNYSTAILAMYDQAVLPLTKLLYSYLTNFLMFRYPDSEDLILAFDPRSITALQPRHTEEINNLQKLNVLTPNETRGLIKLEPLGSGADILYQPGTLLPVAAEAGMPQPPLRTSMPSQNSTNSSDQITQGEQQAAKARFISICKAQIDNEGCRIYNDLEIEEIWKNSKI